MGWACGGVLAAVVAVTLLPLCGVVFGCGCTMWGGRSHCNIHDMHGARCPWCVGGALVWGPGYLVIFGSMAWATYAALGWRWRVWAGVAGGLVAYVLAAAVVSLLTALAVAYPVWMGIRL
jgi:hypothetical protein